MKKKHTLVILLVCLAALLSSCAGAEQEPDPTDSAPSSAPTEVTPSEEDTSTQPEETQPQEREPDTSSPDGETLSWQEVTLTIPEAWEDKYTVETNASGVSFYQKASREASEYMGFLCGIYREDGPFYDLPGGRALAYTEEHMYLLSLPTDVQYDPDNPELAEEYHEMSRLVDALAASMELDADNVCWHPEAYMMPMSECYPLKEDLLLNFDGNQLKIARNEIYARHGYHFTSDYYRLYFDQFSWYEDSGENVSFDASVLSDVERANLELIQRMEAAYAASHPYPLEYAQGASVEADLDGDGAPETVGYELRDGQGWLAVNGREYALEDWDLYLETPDDQYFYLTDISSWDGALEIAVTDNGPSNDPVTHFFGWDGTLIYLGSVGGYPMPQKGDINGFSENMVIGTIRTDVIETAYSYAAWWYDPGAGQLKRSDSGWFQMLPGPSHELSVNLPVYMEPDTDAEMTTIPAQEKVFFTETDGVSWLRVLGKDGSAGYIRVVNGIVEPLGQDADTVFSNLHYAD